MWDAGVECFEIKGGNRMNGIVLVAGFNEVGHRSTVIDDEAFIDVGMFTLIFVVAADNLE